MDIILERILNLIKENSINQKDLVDSLGLGRTVVTEWKSGRSKSYKKYVDKIANYFGVDVNYLLGNTDIKKQAHQNGEPANRPLTEREQIALEALSKLSEENQKFALDYLRYLADRHKD